MSAKLLLTNTLVALHATAHLDKTGDLPTRLKICPWGATETNKGRIICNAATLRELPANNARAKRDRVAIDFNHNTVETAASYKGEPAKVAAYANIEIVEGDGIYLSAIEWTAEGRDHAAGGHYPDLSPAILTNDRGEIIFLHSAGLARQGEIDGIVLFAADPITQSIKQDSTMNYKTILCSVLGVAADADDAAIKTAADSMAEKIKTMSADPKKADPDDVKALSARLDAFETNVKTLTSASETNERSGLVARATREGKVIPLSADQIAVTPVTILSSIVTGLPVTVPVERRTPEGVKEFSAGVHGNTREADEIRENLGVSKEAWDKHNAA